MTYSDAINYLNSLTNFETRLEALKGRAFTLETTREFLEALGNPQEDLKVVHIAGSKGKGSTALLTAGMLVSGGYRVGLYTSPHLYDVRERVRVMSDSAAPQDPDGALFEDCVSSLDFAGLCAELRGVVERKFRGRVTYFEFLTALALVHFQRAGVDAVVLETGLGGRLDATNAVPSLVCGLTRVEREHSGILGGSLEAIAREKAGIVKPGCVRVVSDAQQPEVTAVFEEVCRGADVPLWVVGREIRIEQAPGDTAGFCVVTPQWRYCLSPRVPGAAWQHNTAVAAGLIEALRGLGFESRAAAVEEAGNRLVWPARLEVLAADPVVVVDGAHTPESCRVLVQALAQRFGPCRWALVFGTGTDKDAEGMARELAGSASRVVLTRSVHARAEINLIRRVKPVFLQYGAVVTEAPDAGSALRLAQRGRRSGEILVATGSLYLAAEVRREFLRRRGDENGTGL